MQRETATISKMAHEFLYTIRICNAEQAPIVLLMQCWYFSSFSSASRLRLRPSCINIVHQHLILDNGSLFKSYVCTLYVRHPKKFYGAVNRCIEHCVRDGAQMLIITINEIPKCLTPFAKCMLNREINTSFVHSPARAHTLTHEHSIFSARIAVDIH